MAKWSDPDADYEADRRRAGRARGQDQRRRTRGTSSATSTSRWTPCAARPTTPTSRRCPAARSAASRSAGCCSSTPTCCCSTSPPTTSTPSRSSGSSASSRSTPGTVVAITHDRYFLDNVAQWILELDRGRGIPFSGNYSSWLEQKLERMAREQKTADARQRTLARELEWVRMGAEGAPGEGQGPPRAPTSSCSPRRTTRRAPSASSRSPSRPGRGSATRSSRSTACARATATGC